MNITYIAGPITNTPNYHENFATAESKLKSRGDIVWNPATMPEGLPHEAYMHICYAIMDVSDTIYLLHGWRKSKGACMEYDYAMAKGMRVMFDEQ